MKKQITFIRHKYSSVSFVRFTTDNPEDKWNYLISLCTEQLRRYDDSPETIKSLTISPAPFKGAKRVKYDSTGYVYIKGLSHSIVDGTTAYINDIFLLDNTSPTKYLFFRFNH